MKPPAPVGPWPLTATGAHTPATGGHPCIRSQDGPVPLPLPPNRGCHRWPSPGLLMWQLSLASHRAGTWLRGAPATRPRVVKRQSGTHATWSAQRTKGCPCTPAADSNPTLLAGHPHVPQPSGQWCPSLKVPGPQAGQCPDRWQVPAQTSAHVPGVAWGPLARRLYLLPHPCPARSLEEVPMSFRCQGAHGGVGGGGSPPSAVWQPNPTTLGWHHLPPPV